MKMKMTSLILAASAVLLIGCAHAGEFAGKWLDMYQGNHLIVKNLGHGHYTAKMQRETELGARYRWMTVATYEFTRHGDELDGYLKHGPTLTFTLKHEGAKHLILIGHVLRGAILFRRIH